MKRRMSMARMFLCAALFCLVPCGDAPFAADPAPLRLAVSILPQRTFLQKLAGPEAKIDVMVLPGASPHTYEPRPGQMKALAETALYFSIGVPFEKTWLPKFQGLYPSLRVVPTDAGISKRAIDGHGHGHAHAKGAHPDPHIWLSPPLVKIQAGHMAAALMDRDPLHRQRYSDNLKGFEQEIDTLDKDLRTILGRPGASRAFLVFHPSWGYFADAYGLEQIAIEMEGKEPSARELEHLITLARAHGIRVVFVQPQFNRKMAETLSRELQARVSIADPLREDWAANLREVATDMAGAMGNRP